MKNVKYYALVLLTIILSITVMCGCKTHKSITVEHTIKDSVSTKIEKTYRDTTVKIKGDSVKLNTEVKADTNGVVNLPEVIKKSKRSVVKVKITDNKLEADCLCPDLEEKLKIADTKITNYESRIEKLSKREVVPERFIPEWIKWLAAFGTVCIALFIIWIVLNLKKLINGTTKS